MAPFLEVKIVVIAESVELADQLCGIFSDFGRTVSFRHLSDALSFFSAGFVPELIIVDITLPAPAEVFVEQCQSLSPDFAGVGYFGICSWVHGHRLYSFARIFQSPVSLGELEIAAAGFFLEPSRIRGQLLRLPTNPGRAV